MILVYNMDFQFNRVYLEFMFKMGLKMFSLCFDDFRETHNRSVQS